MKGNTCMLIGFLGGPCSGKTTLAAKIFFEFKEQGKTVEFIPERARFQIAKQKLLRGTQNIELSNSDQFTIMFDQLDHESIMKNSIVNNKDAIIITDSCIYNSLAYMNSTYIDSSKTIKEIIHMPKMYDLLFFCDTVPFPREEDNNRVHGEREATEIATKLQVRLSRYTPEVKYTNLSGNLEERYTQFKQVFNDYLRESNYN